MENCPLDPSKGITIIKENAIAGSISGEGHRIVFTVNNNNLYYPPIVFIADLFYRYSSNFVIACAYRGIPETEWRIGQKIGTIPLSIKTIDLPPSLRLQMALEEAFGPKAQKKMRAVMTIARLRQEYAKWVDSPTIGLTIDREHNTGLLTTIVRFSRRSTKLIKRTRRKIPPPNLHEFLGSACCLYLNKDMGEAKIYHRPPRPRAAFDSRHEKMDAIQEMIEAFEENGIDIIPWIEELLSSL